MSKHWFSIFQNKGKSLNTLNLVIFSLLFVLIYHILIIVIVKLNNWTFTIASIDSASEKLNIGYYLDIEKIAPWFKISLSIINLEQLMITILLSIGINKIMRINYKRAISIAIRTYGISILLWFVFVTIMEMNFS